MRNLIFVFFLQLVRTSSLPPSQCKTFSLFAISLATACRCPDVFYYDEDQLHLLASKIRTISRRSSLAIQHVSSAVEVEYVSYLQRLRAKTIGQENLGNVVQAMTQNRAFPYNTMPTPIKVIRMIKNTLLQGTTHIPDMTFGGDLVLQEYHHSLRAALESYFLTFHGYREFIRFPYNKVNASMLECLKAIQNFVFTTLNEFDSEATYPDAVMCLSYLQFIKYVALTKSEWVFAKNAVLQYEAVLTTLNNL